MTARAPLSDPGRPRGFSQSQPPRPAPVGPQGIPGEGLVSECGLLQPCPSPRGRELHSLHQEQHQLSTLQGHQVSGKSGQRRRRPLEALGGHGLSPLTPCSHVDFLLGAEARLGPCMWGGCLQLQGLWEERLWGLGGRGPPSSWAGWVPFQLACCCLLACAGATWWRRWMPAT